MRAVDIITKKRDGGELNREELEFFVQGFASGEIPDYQVAAWAMAVLFRGMTPRETFELTMAMMASGDQIDISSVAPSAVDKHSTGGVGDKTTLVVEPLVAACGVPVCKISGRGLGFSGGTLDKMESIPGFQVDLTKDEFLAQLKKVGLVLSGQSDDLAPADGKLYALRDVTGTVPSIPLIASSVMCKKLAGGAHGIVLDVKVGAGAFMKDVPSAVKLGRLMVDIGKRTGRRVMALISDMNQPLGCAVGNALEVREALDTHRGRGPKDFLDHCLRVAGLMLLLAGKAATLRQGERLAAETLESGAALRKLRELVEAQGGDPTVVDDPDKLPRASHVKAVASPREGYIEWVDAALVGMAGVRLGAGRAKKGDAIDHSVGLIIQRKVGDRVRRGDPLFIVHANDVGRLDAAASDVLAAHRFSRSPVKPLPLFYRTIRS